MPTYTVHEPPAEKSDRLDRAEDLSFIKDGFSWLTAIFPPLGFAAAGLWLLAFGYLIIAAAFCWILEKIGLSPGWTTTIMLAISVYLGFEMSSFRRWVLDQQGWSMVGTVTGKTLEECERRFFESWLPGQPVLKTAATTATAANPITSLRAKSAIWPFGTGA